jgi:hypothetical protein
MAKNFRCGIAPKACEGGRRGSFRMRVDGLRTRLPVLQVFASLSESLHPLHRALYIHAQLNALDEMKQYYENNRLPQVLHPPTGSEKSNDVLRPHRFLPPGYDPDISATVFTR